jgi:virulence factor Mce-like protein
MKPRRVTSLLAMVAVVALAAAGCSLPGGGGGGYKVVAYFDRAVSVYPSSQVRVLGLPAGSVNKVEVVGNQVKVTMTIEDKIPLPQGVKAQIVPQSLIGERYIQLAPAWREGDPKISAGYEIQRADTITPVEPDEALAAVKKFLDSLDPKGLGQLINNADDALHGNGAELNSALDQISKLVGTFAEKDDTLVSIVDNFDRLTTTLRTRESQLGSILQTFSQATQVLADERANIQALLASLASLSANGVDLVQKHSAALRTDLDTLARLANSIDTNLDKLAELLDSGPLLVSGLANAYNPDLRAMNLRTSFSPLLQQLLNPVLKKVAGLLGIPFTSVPCIPVDVLCSAVTTNASSTATPVDLPAATTPVDDLLLLLGAPTVPAAPGPSAIDRVANGLSGVGGFLDDAGHAMVGAS